MGNLAYLRGDLGRQNEAEEASLQVLLEKVLGALAGGEPFISPSSASAKGLTIQGDIYQSVLRWKDAEAAYQAALDLRIKLMAADRSRYLPESRRDAQRPRTSLPDDPTRRLGAEKMFAEALDTFQASRYRKFLLYDLADLAEALGQMGLLYVYTRRLEAAEKGLP